jgi:hypothetical protein
MPMPPVLTTHSTDPNGTEFMEDTLSVNIEILIERRDIAVLAMATSALHNLPYKITSSRKPKPSVHPSGQIATFAQLKATVIASGLGH